MFAKCGATSFLYVQEDHHILTVDVKFKVFLKIRALVTEEFFFKVCGKKFYNQISIKFKENNLLTSISSSNVMIFSGLFLNFSAGIL